MATTPLARACSAHLQLFNNFNALDVDSSDEAVVAVDQALDHLREALMALAEQLHEEIPSLPEQFGADDPLRRMPRDPRAN